MNPEIAATPFGPDADKADFLQSSLWASFQEAAGKPSLILEEAGIQGYAFAEQLPIVGKCLYFPHGPLIGPETEPQDVRRVLMNLSRRKGAAFLRAEPRSARQESVLREAFGLRFRPAPHDTQPREIFVIDITPSEEALLARMKPKTRYNMRLAAKRGVSVFPTRERKYQEAFLDLIEATAARKEIRPHPRNYYEACFRSMPEENLTLFVAEYEGEVIAANMLLVYGGTATYLHGGSADRHRGVMAPYLLQWEQIRYARDHGCSRYDFGGVRHRSRQSGNTRWDGITRFKLGFSLGTEPLLFPGTYDIITDIPRYVAYRVFRAAFRKRFRR